MSWEKTKAGFDTAVVRLSGVLGVVFFSGLIWFLGFVAAACIMLAIVKYG